MNKKCPFCKTGFLERKTIKETYTYKGQRFEIEQPGEFCTLCDEGVLNANDLKSTEKQIRDFQAKIDGLLTSSEILKVRQKLKLSQKQAAEICGNDLNTFSRYERGEATPQRAISNLLIILNNHPELLLELMPSGHENRALC
ncbi:MAG: antitoxin [Candidatus Parabeggiatoa sp. nov. 3]|nr:MAG: antitoxin [Gammaproteobacteria bacterium]RKZ68856.1 MAG: antitoxin [Gammaproteobacteria bacterium]RKZ89259.1 MAG: antitoxin [Gammaproteobacteria bacterium]